MMFTSHTPEYRRVYRAKNKMRINKQYRDCYAKNPEAIKARVNAAVDLEAIKEKHALDPRRRMVVTAKHRARRLGLPFNLSVSDFTIPEVCPALGIPLRVSRGRPTDNSPSLDKVIPELGYVRGNVAVISLRANRIKYDATLDELVKLAVWFRSLNTANPQSQSQETYEQS